MTKIIKNKSSFYLGLAVVIVGGALYLVYRAENKPTPIIACTQEAKLCPDGSSVGRTGPDCSFAPCPSATLPDYANISFSIDGTEVQLVNGVSSVPSAPGSASMTTVKYFGNVALGDLNGDGKNDAVFLVTESGGGSGTFYYVVGALLNGDHYKGTNAVFLGDRIAPQTTEVQNGTITVNYADRAPGEPMTAVPSVGVSRHFRMEAEMLTEVK